MVFAAGFGTRLAPLTDRLPKPMIEVGGRPMIDRAIDHGRGAGCDPIVANTHHLADTLEPHLRAQGVGIAREPGPILDTGGGLKAARPLLPGDLAATINPDALWLGPNPIATLCAAWDDAGDALLLLVRGDRASGREGPGDFDLTPGGRLVRGGPYVFGGAQILRLAPVTDRPETVFSLNLVWNQMASAGRLRGHVYDGDWCDLGTPEGLTAGRALT